MSNTQQNIEIKVTQCDVGRYNLIGNEETLSFYMGIYKDGSIVQDGETKAQLHYSGDPGDKYIFEEALENMEDVFRQCYAYAHRVCSSTDYKANCLLFARVYSENYEAIDDCMIQKQKERLQRQIAELQKKLTHNTILPQIIDTVNACIDKQTARYKKWIAQAENDLLQFKEDSILYAETKKKIESYQNTVAKYEAHKMIEA